jgi:hypothetical protein
MWSVKVILCLLLLANQRVLVARNRKESDDGQTDEEQMARDARKELADEAAADAGRPAAAPKGGRGRGRGRGAATAPSESQGALGSRPTRVTWQEDVEAALIKLTSQGRTHPQSLPKTKKGTTPNEQFYNWISDKINTK